MGYIYTLNYEITNKKMKQFKFHKYIITLEQ